MTHLRMADIAKDTIAIRRSRGGVLAFIHRFVPYEHGATDEKLASHPRTQVLDILATIICLAATLAYATVTYEYLKGRPPIQEYFVYNAGELAEKPIVVGDGRTLKLSDLAADIIVGVEDFGGRGNLPTTGVALVRQTYSAQGRDQPGCGPEGCQDSYAGYPDACPNTAGTDALGGSNSWSCESSILDPALLGPGQNVKGSCVKTTLCYTSQGDQVLNDVTCAAGTRAAGANRKEVMGVTVLGGNTNVSSVRYWLGHVVPSLNSIGKRLELKEDASVELIEGEIKTMYLRQKLEVDFLDSSAPLKRNLVVSRIETAQMRSVYGAAEGQIGCDVLDAPSVLRIRMSQDFDVVVTKKLSLWNDFVGLVSGFSSLALGIAGTLRSPFLPKLSSD